MTESTLDLIRAWAWLKGLLNLVLLHLGTETDHGRVVLRADLILPRTGEEMSFTDAEVASETGADDVRNVLVVERSNISLVLAWPWHIKVLVSASAHLDTHMEFRIRFGLFELPEEFVCRWGRGEEIRGLRVFSGSHREPNSNLSVGNMLGIVTLWSDWSFRLLILVLTFVGLRVCVRHDPEARRVIEFFAIISARAWYSVNNVLLFQRTSQYGFS